MAENENRDEPVAESGEEKHTGMVNLSARMALGIILGAALGIAFNQLALGITLGLAAGILYDRYRTRKDGKPPGQGKNSGDAPKSS